MYGLVNKNAGKNLRTPGQISELRITRPIEYHKMKVQTYLWFVSFWLCTCQEARGTRNYKEKLG